MLSLAASLFFFFKQKTAYELRISDWSSDVCSSDLSIGQVDRRMRNATQRKTGGVARRRPIESRTQAALIVDRWTVSLLPVPQCQRRITERAGHADQITDQIGRASCRERVCQYV